MEPVKKQKPFKYVLVNVDTREETKWVSVYQLKKFYGVNEASFFYAMRYNKVLELKDGRWKLYLDATIEEEEEC